MAIFIIVFVLAPKYEEPLKTSDDVEKKHISINRVSSLVTAEGIPRGYVASPVHVPCPPGHSALPVLSGHTAYCNVLASCQQGQPLGERDAVMIQVLFALNIKHFEQQRQLCTVVLSKIRTPA